MKGRIKHGDLDHLLRLIEKGRLEDGSARHFQEDDDGDLPGSPDHFAENHAIWNANHAYWVDKLKTDTNGTWTDAQYTSAATILNTAEYQHVVFSDIAGVLTRGLSDGWYGRHGHDRSDHFHSRTHESSRFDETFDLVDASTGHVHQVRLAFVVDDLSRPHRLIEPKDDGSEVPLRDADRHHHRVTHENLYAHRAETLGELTGVRSRHAGHVSFNEARGELYAQCGLSTLLPYAGWDDFRDRNHLSDDLIDDLKAAYPDGFASVDLWVGGLAERPAAGNIGPTIAAAVGAETGQLQRGHGATCLDLLAGTHLLSVITAQSWPDIVGRITGEAHLADYVLAQPEHAVAAEIPNIIHGTDGDDVLIGTDGHDIIFGGPGNDFLDGGHNADVLVGGPGNDTYVVDDVRDHVVETVDGGVDTVLTDLKAFALEDDDASPAAPTHDASDTGDASQTILVDDTGGSGVDTTAPVPEEATTQTDDDQPGADLTDFGRAANVENLTYTGEDGFIGRGNSANNIISGGAGNDSLWGEGGDDVLYGSGGDDDLHGGSGNDVLFGGYGDDRFDGGFGDDMIYLANRSTGADADDGAYGQDTIVLRPGFGNDIVVGFDANDTEGHDRLDVSAYASLTADSIGTDIRITSCGPHTIITINEDSITLLDVNATTIGKDDFIFS